MKRKSQGRTALVTATVPTTVHHFYQDIMRVLAERGYAIHVVTSLGDGLPRVWESADAVHIVQMQRAVTPIADLLALVRWVLLLRRVRPELVLAGTPKAGLLGMLAAWVTRVPRRAYFLQGLRLEGTHGAQRLLLSALERLASHCSHIVIAVSPSLARRYVELGLASATKVLVPHHGSSHGVDPYHFSPKQRNAGLLADIGLNPDVPVLAFIGRLTYDKGLDTLSQAVRRVVDRGRAVQLLVLGSQDERDSAAYLHELRDLGVEIAVLGHLADVRPYLAVADLLLLPTRREGMPNVVLEAAAMAIPAITTDATGAVDSVVDGVTGLIVPVGDSRALAQAIDRMLGDPALKASMGAAGRRRVVTDFKPTDVATAIVEYARGRFPSQPL